MRARRDIYYDNLLAVSRDDDWTGWVEFFLEAIREQAKNNLEKAEKVIGLYENMKAQVADMTRSQHAIRALDRIFEWPILNASSFSNDAGIPKPSAQRILRVLRDGGILREMIPGSGRRAGVFVFPALLNIVEGRDVF